MLAIERRNLILTALQEDKRVLVADLSQRYDVSEETIRRDLEKLEKEGYVKKTYGGAVINEDTNVDLPFMIRKKKNVIGKQRIAELAAELVEDGDRVMLDGSSTAVFIAKRLKTKRNLTVITNSIEILIELSDVSGWKIMSTGGTMKEGSLALEGHQTERMLGSYHVDKAFVSCKGVDAKNGITDLSESYAAAKKLMLDAADKRILAVDSTKFDCVSFTRIVNFDGITTILTDKEPSAAWKQFFAGAGIECVCPQA